MKHTLRPYQQEAIDALYGYFDTKTGNPLVVLPTGSGKSLTMAAFIRGAIEQYPGTRIILLTHVKELIKQDAQAIIRYWPEAPIGLWSSGLNSKVKDQITVAGIQSIHKKPTSFAGTDLVIIDEAHLLSKNGNTMYRRFIDGLMKHNEYLKVIGMTATPYRMDSGLLTDGKERIFTDIVYEAGVGDLMKQGYLCPMVARNGATKPDLSGVHTRGGEFVKEEVQNAMDQHPLIEGALDEIMTYAHDREHILGFCAGTEHARHFAKAANARGWAADHVNGYMSPSERDSKIKGFTSGGTRILFNDMLLTTGFDYPAVDCIAMLRPTKSTGLYCQTMGRGLRIHPSKENTLVLDFAGNVERHGPIDMIRVKRKAEKGEGVSVAPVKECQNCQALVFAGVRECPECGHLFPENQSEQHGTEASDAVVVAALEKPRVYVVDSVTYRRHKKIGAPDSLKVTYWCGVSTFNEWLPIEDIRSHVKKHAVTWFWHRGAMCPATVTEALELLNEDRIPAPDTITVKMDGKYWRVVSVDMGSRRLDISTVIDLQGAKTSVAF